MERSLVVLALVAIVALAAILLRRGGERRRAPARVDPSDFGLEGMESVGVVGFASPYCLACERWEGALHEAGVPWARVDVAERQGLAHRYRVAVTPLFLAVELPSGRVIEAYHGDPDPADVERLARLATG